MSHAQEAARQTALVQALLQGGGQDLTPGLRALRGVAGGAARGLQAYRGNAQALADKALAAPFPRLRAWLGEADFAQLAWTFWRRCPPRQGELGRWAEALPDFLTVQSGLEDGAAWLPDVARIEWAIHAAEQAADAALEVDTLQALAQEDPARLVLRLRPGLRLLSVAPAAAALWLPELAHGTAPVALLVWRQAWKAELCDLSPDWRCFMQNLLAGLSLAQALERCLAAHPAFDVAAWLASALSRAWLQSVHKTLPKDSP